MTQGKLTPERLAAVHWVLTLVDPLLPVADRDHYLDKMSEVTRSSPDWSQLFFAGVISDMILTLPTTDPWRRLSARVGDVTVGTAPPDSDGAVRPDGNRFGTWRDCTDVIEPVFDHPQLDPALAAVASDLPSQAAVLLAAAAHGWSQARLAAAEVSKTGDLFDAAHAAMSWSMHRRRAYGVQTDPWPIESVYRWSWRADRSERGQQWPADQVDEAIEDQSIEDMLTAGIIQPG